MLQQSTTENYLQRVKKIDVLSSDPRPFPLRGTFPRNILFYTEYTGKLQGDFTLFMGSYTSLANRADPTLHLEILEF